MTENQWPQAAGARPPDDEESTDPELAGGGPRSGGPGQDANPLASGQLAETPQSNTRMADDPLNGKQPADDPLGSDPLTLDRRNPPRAPGQ
ncbi:MULTISPECIES: hypothetical protein [unclassified Arthrobacter]|uniref:hypothetical protein n=1 Tax=unclassified Arthrobacter TaxID=235627 RepID=UPI001F2A85D3|nr:hypothetical protein [Arthrobacter sp. FW305-BF8]UKA54850.1 hypothetical protein LFT45_02545 [Arthrobacter sp. FW305-BF8]